MTAILIKHRLPGGRSFAASDVDSPGMGALAVAVQKPDGWTVAAVGGRVVAHRLTKRRAVALMLRTAAAQSTTNARLAFGGAR